LILIEKLVFRYLNKSEGKKEDKEMQKIENFFKVIFDSYLLEVF